MTLLQGIQLHELIMIILGFILGLSLIFVFLFTALKSKPNLKLLYGFVAPVVMIGYPSFKSAEFQNEVVKIDKLVAKVNANPTDTLAQQELVQTIQTSLPASRCKTSSDAMATIANVQAALGQYDSAKVTIQKAIALDKTSTKAVESQKDIINKWEVQKKTEQRINQIDNIVKRIQSNPNDVTLRDSLKHHLDKLESTTTTPVHIENKKLLVVAQAVSMVGQKQEAIQIADEVLKANPNQTEATKLKENIKTRETDKRTRTSTSVKPSTSKPKETEISKYKKVETVPAPAPVFQDTARLNIRLLPKTGIEVKRFWNNKE